MDHLHPHINTLSHYLGVDKIHTIRSEYQEFNDERHQASLKKANTEVINLVAQLILATNLESFSNNRSDSANIMTTL